MLGALEVLPELWTMMPIIILAFAMFFIAFIAQIITAYYAIRLYDEVTEISRKLDKITSKRETT
jgi:uncharacterized membrane protein